MHMHRNELLNVVDEWSSVLKLLSSPKHSLGNTHLVAPYSLVSDLYDMHSALERLRFQIQGSVV